MTFISVALSCMSEPIFENLGEPVVERDLRIWVVTPTADGGHIAWGQRKRTAVVGIDIGTGKSFELDITKHGRTNIVMAPAPDGSLVYYAGNPGCYFRYAPDGTLSEVGVPAKPASYWMQGAVGPDEMFYVGTYPAATLVACDLRNWTVTSHGAMTDDKRQKYIIDVEVSDANIVYASVGLHHQELWSYNPRTGVKRQILPDSMLGTQGAPRIWTGTDGHVYGRDRQGVEFRCLPDGIEVGDVEAERKHPNWKRAGKWSVMRVDDAGKLILEAPGEDTRTVQTDYTGRALEMYSVCCERDGRIYGGTVFPGRLYGYDTDTKAFADLPDATPGAIQIYDVYSHPNGLFLASYMGCKLDFYNPDAPTETGVNPRRFKAGIKGQERPVQWEMGPDGKLYFGTVPDKGRLGGALVRVDPATFEVKTHAQIIPDQSIHYLCSVQETGELFGCASISGGSSSIPTQTEADVFLWDVKTERVVWRGQPIPGTKTYLRAVRAPNGLIVGVTSGQWYLFDPGKREVVHRGELPVQRLRFPCLIDDTGATDGRIVGVGDDAVFAIDADKRDVEVLARHPSLHGTRGFMVADDGTLFYGSDTALWACRNLVFGGK